MTHPLRSTGITPLQHYYEAVRPSPAHQYFRPRGWSRLCLFPWHRRPGLTFRTRARLSFAPPPCRMPLGQSQCIPQADPGGMATPRFASSNRLRHVISGSLRSPLSINLPKSRPLSHVHHHRFTQQLSNQHLSTSSLLISLQLRIPVDRVLHCHEPTNAPQQKRPTQSARRQRRNPPTAAN